MLARLSRALNLAAALVAACALASVSVAQTTTTAKPATTTKKPAPVVRSPSRSPDRDCREEAGETRTAAAATAAATRRTHRAHRDARGCVSRGSARPAQFDGEGRRAAAPRFDAQPVQGVSSIKPGATAGAWWALSDNGFGGKWNSSDYRLCIYLFDVRPRTEAGRDSRNALQAVIELSDPAKFFPWRLADENSDRATAHGPRCRPGVAGHHARRILLDRR